MEQKIWLNIFKINKNVNIGFKTSNELQNIMSNKNENSNKFEKKE